MASKNPIKGYVRCHMPDCNHVASVHAVGEHRILQEGQPPKNKRNTGRLYYNCPSCGFQQGKGQTFQDWITSHMKASKSDFDEVTASPKQEEPKPLPKPLVEVAPKPEPTKLEAEEVATPNSSRQRTITYLLAVVGIISFIYMLMKPRSTPNEQRA